MTKFSLTLFGGKKGLIQMSSGFCAHPNAAVNLVGQNGKLSSATPVVAAKACGGGGKKKHHRGH